MTPQTPIRLYIAVIPENRQNFADCFSGHIDETSIVLVEQATGNTWWGANGNLYYPQEINRLCLAAAQAWYRAIAFELETGHLDENGNPVIAYFPDGIIAEDNIPGSAVGSPDPGFDAFLSACGLARVPT